MDVGAGAQAEHRQGQRHATLADVADATNVSSSTVSRALRGSPLVNEATRRRIRAAADRLGYEPNRFARSLRTRSSHLVGVVIPDICHPFYGRIVKGAQDALEREGYQLLVLNSERQPGREIAALRTLLAHQVDGLLIATSGGLDGPPSVPAVFVDNLALGMGVANVALDNRRGMRILVDHLVEHRHTRIAYIGAPAILTSATERLEGFHAAVGAHGLSIPSEYDQIGDENWSPPSGGEAMRALLALPTPPTAVVTASDTLALGAMEAGRRAGVRVPDDVALVSFDDPFFGELLDPPLTTLGRNEREIGELAASLLLEALRTRRPRPSLEIRIPVELIVRRSCGCSYAP